MLLYIPLMSLLFLMLLMRSLFCSGNDFVIDVAVNVILDAAGAVEAVYADGGVDAVDASELDSDVDVAVDANDFIDDDAKNC